MTSRCWPQAFILGRQKYKQQKIIKKTNNELGSRRTPLVQLVLLRGSRSATKILKSLPTRKRTAKKQEDTLASARTTKEKQKEKKAREVWLTTKKHTKK